MLGMTVGCPTSKSGFPSLCMMAWGEMGELRATSPIAKNTSRSGNISETHERFVELSSIAGAMLVAAPTTDVVTML